jgi:tetratricopeptide (TPR) repeat protein
LGAQRLANRLIHRRAQLLNRETIVTAYDLLGSARVAAGNGADAIEPTRCALELQAQLYGIGEPGYQVTVGVLGAAFLATGKMDPAEGCFRQSASGLRTILGRNDAVYAASLVDMAELSSARGRVPEAESLFHEAMSVFEQGRANDPAVVRCIDHLAKLYISQGEYTAANDALREALWKAGTCLCEDHPKLAEILEHQAIVLRKLNRPVEADAADARARSVRARFADRVARDAKSDSAEDKVQ